MVINLTMLLCILAGILSSVRTPRSVHGTATYRREYKNLRDKIANDLFNLFNETVFDNRVCRMIVYNFAYIKMQIDLNFALNEF